VMPLPRCRNDPRASGARRPRSIPTVGGWNYGIDQFKCGPVSAGRRDDFMAVALEGMKLFERHGGRHARLLAAATAGEMSMGYVLTNEFANAEDYGAFVDDLYSDAELESFLARITAADSPLVIESRSVATEIPLERSGIGGPGGVIEV
jgi:hypothetical protein